MTTYVRCYAFGKKCPYDGNKMVKINETICFSFKGPNGNEINLSRKVKELDIGEWKVSAIVKMCRPIIQKYYPEDIRNDIVEGVEIITESNITYIHIYRPFKILIEN